MNTNNNKTVTGWKSIIKLFFLAWMAFAVLGSYGGSDGDEFSSTPTPGVPSITVGLSEANVFGGEWVRYRDQNKERIMVQNLSCWCGDSTLTCCANSATRAATPSRVASSQSTMSGTGWVFQQK